MNMPEAKKLTLPTAHYHRHTARLPAIAPGRKGCAFQEDRTVWTTWTAETPQQARGPIAVNTASNLYPVSQHPKMQEPGTGSLPLSHNGREAEQTELRVWDQTSHI